MQEIRVCENGISIHIEIAEDGDVRLYRFAPVQSSEHVIAEERKKKYRLLELQVTGENQNDHHGSKHTGTCPADRLKYKGHKEYRNELGLKLELYMAESGLEVTVHYQLFDGIPVIRAWSEVKNTGSASKGIEYITSFAYTGIAQEGIGGWEQKSRVHIPHNTWMGELQWKAYPVHELGLRKNYQFSMKRITAGSTGTWSTSEHLPMGCYENLESNSLYFWQIENNGSWHWEISDMADQLYLQLSGPCESENQWWLELKPGQTFKSVPVAIGTLYGDFEAAMQVLTQYRRRIIRPCADNRKLPVIFNDYMNCLMGDPTTEKLLPLIDAAADAGCEYFCIDAGWYSDGVWWDGVGEWLPSQKRFPNGIREPLCYIREKGMIPGIWLEIESVGINSPIAQNAPDTWFFVRHGKRVVSHSRLQLDFRNPEVIRHADAVIDRLVKEYGAGYIKMDYNVEYGAGTELMADSFGDGLLQHGRAYLDWTGSVFERYPELVIENCGSGGCRMDYGMLSKHSIQSSSDNMDYKRYAVISAASPTAVLPEQCACWSYPLRDGDHEEVIFNMVNAMLLRIHQSGHLAEITDERRSYVKEGIAYYKTFREDIPRSLPIWPLGLPGYTSTWTSLGLIQPNKVYLAVWRLENGQDTCTLPIRDLAGKQVEVKCAFPLDGSCEFQWHRHQGVLSVKLDRPCSARIFELTY